MRPFGLPKTYEKAKPEIAEAVAVLSAAYPRQQVSVETVRLYVVALANAPLADLAWAVEQHIRTSQFFPTVADILRKIAIKHAGLPVAEEALCRMMQGNYVALSPRAKEAITEAREAVNVDFQMETGSNWRGQFLKVYDALRENWISTMLEDL